jgi:hypothetical protein
MATRGRFGARLGALVGLVLAGVSCGLEPMADETVEGSAAAYAPPSGCPAAPAGLDPDAVAAIEEVNRVRKTVGLGCISLLPTIADAARRHCDYYVNNTGKCTSKPHREMAECKSFRAETFSDRLKMASYPGNPRFEVMAYVGHGPTAVGQWLDSVWHRIPITSPDVDEAGYGKSGRCDTMDFGLSTSTSEPKNLVYPFDGQTEVPRSFSGRESPEPPPPPEGWPSGYPVSLNAPGMTVREHTIMVDGGNEDIPHTFMAPGDARAHDLLVDEFFLYTHRPLAARTRYRVHLAGEQNGKPLAFDWTFTTR